MTVVSISFGAGSARIAYAWYTESKQVVNTVTVAENTIRIEESIDGMYKRPRVSNIGSLPCYVRIRAVISDGDIQKYISLDYDTANFTYHSEDGFYYYKKVLDPGEQTEPLFQKVTVSKDIPAELSRQQFDIDVYAESVYPDGTSDPVSAFRLGVEKEGGS